MRHFFDNVRSNNKTAENLQDEKETLRADITHLRDRCCGPFEDNERARLFELLHSI